MKALTIHQPWATLIAKGQKWVENRTWSTDYRGPLAIHASRNTAHIGRRSYPTGCVVAVAELAAIVELNAIDAAELEDAKITEERLKWHVHTEGPFCWILNDVRKLDEPIEAIGQQGLWEWDPDATSRPDEQQNLF